MTPREHEAAEARERHATGAIIDAFDRVRAAIVAKGNSLEDADRWIELLLAPLMREANERHYQRGESHASVDAWYAGAVKAALTRWGFGEIARDL